VFLVVRTNTS